MTDKRKNTLGASANRVAVKQVQAKLQEGFALHQNGQLAQAQAIYEQILKLQSRHFDALHLLGVIALQSANPGRAAELIGKAIEINPNNAEAYTNRGNALRSLNQPQAALESYERAIALKPGSAEAYYNRGNTLLDLKQPQAALESYDRAIAMKPDYADAFNNRGNALFNLKQSQTALESYGRAIALKADFADAYYNRGNALRDLKQPKAAVESYDLAIALKTDFADAYYSRGNALRDLKQPKAAVESYDRALALGPYDFLFGTLIHAKMTICDWHDFDKQIPELLQKIARGEKATPPSPPLALTSDASLHRKAAQIYVQTQHSPILQLPQISKWDRHKRIRIGYYSADFHDHAVPHLMAGVFEAHDKNHFECFAFSFGPNNKSEMRTRLTVAFDRFYEVRDQSDKDVVLLSRKLEVDIAVDLSGFTRDSRTNIFAHRAAPLQVNYLGYPGTMAAEYIDYLIADTTLIPQESRKHYAEKIAYLPNSYQPNDTTRRMSEKTFTRPELGLPHSGFVFCCFNNNYKITPGTFDGWMRILCQVKGSVLWLLKDSPVAAANLQKEAVRRGVDGERLVFAERVPLAEHLARHRVANLFIDTLPYNAHTTASDALWAGLPVLTCVAEGFASRVAASVLKAIGLPELITTTQQEYEALAIELATNPARLTSIKQKLERNRNTTPLFDTKLFVKHLEQAYTTMYERHQAGLPPDDFYVAP